MTYPFEDETSPEQQEAENTTDMMFEVPFNVETEWQKSRRQAWFYATLLMISSMFASCWIALVFGEVRFWLSTVVFLVLTLFLGIVTTQVPAKT